MEDKEFSALAVKLFSEIRDKTLLIEVITKAIEKEFNIDIPLDERRLYKIETFNRVIKALIYMVAHTIQLKDEAKPLNSLFSEA